MSDNELDLEALRAELNCAANDVIRRDNWSPLAAWADNHGLELLAEVRRLRAAGTAATSFAVAMAESGAGQLIRDLEAEIKHLRLMGELRDRRESDAAILAGLEDEKARGLEAEVRRLREERRWIPISEDPPLSGESVLVVDDCGNVRLDPCVIVAFDQRWLGTAAAGNYTHWMPLPEPPAAQP